MAGEIPQILSGRCGFMCVCTFFAQNLHSPVQNVLKRVEVGCLNFVWCLSDQTAFFTSTPSLSRMSAAARFDRLMVRPPRRGTVLSSDARFDRLMPWVLVPFYVIPTSTKMTEWAIGCLYQGLRDFYGEWQNGPRTVAHSVKTVPRRGSRFARQQTGLWYLSLHQTIPFVDEKQKAPTCFAFGRRFRCFIDIMSSLEEPLRGIS